MTIGKLIVGVTFDGMTYADLRAFVKMTAGQPDSQEVGHMVNPDGHYMAGLEDWIKAPGDDD